MAKFTVDTHLFRELGELLVGRDSTALVELIKNSYDADATEVIVDGQNLDDPQRGKITIRDNGIGMTRTHFELGFLRIASRLKEHGKRLSFIFERRYTGAKGIGRLSAHKLSRTIHIYSIPSKLISDEGARHSVDVSIDWDQIESRETLDDIEKSDAIELRTEPVKEDEMKTPVKSVPAGYHTVTPTLVVKDAKKALEFYKRAFGAEERMRFLAPDESSIMHAEIKIGDSVIMLGEENPEMGCSGPQTLGGTPVSLYLYVDDADQAFTRAVSAGAKADMPVADMFWGDRFGQVVDPFGHKWNLATHKEDVTPEEMRKRASTFFAQMASHAV